MLLPILSFLLGPAVVGLLYWLTRKFRYQITAEAVEILLFGLCVRRLPLADIRAVSKRRAFWSEHWWNTHRTYRRLLVIHRHRGLLKNFVVTPRKRYVFKAHLERAIQQLHGARYTASDEFDEGEAGEAEDISAAATGIATATPTLQPEERATE